MLFRLLFVLFLSTSAFAGPPQIYSSDGKYLGNLSSNPSDPNSANNPSGQYGSASSPDSINNKSGRYGSTSSPYSVNNPSASGATTPKTYSSDGKYLGNLSVNISDPNSISNISGQYGSMSSPDSLYDISGGYIWFDVQPR
jgi:hypothetical protein